ncbi:hypothetical protein [Paraburkholderia caribensis]|uniref:hypothetical protein n=1 Tax=Paraburkholderia caribensis TaxID=75105 RepID=UPI0015916BE6|nr:hypothetical protein [Paraburkholderia caribensis]
MENKIVINQLFIKVEAAWLLPRRTDFLTCMVFLRLFHVSAASLCRDMLFARGVNAGTV